MGLFGSGKRKQQEALAAAAAVKLVAAKADRARREDAWRADRTAACARLREARRVHAEARRVYERYAPGPKKAAAARAVDVAADELARVEQEFAAVDIFQAWSRTR